MEPSRIPGTPGQPGSLEEEVERLAAAVRAAQGRIRILQWSLALAVFLGLAGGAAGLYQAGLIPVAGFAPPMPNRVEAREFGFYNRFGERLILTADDKFGLPQFIFMDRKKEYRLGIKVWPEGDGTPGLVFYDKTGMRGNFRMDGDGSAVINLVGEQKKGGIALAVAPDGTPSLKMTDASGKVVFQAPAAAR
jgi:hypothetical protein